MSIDEKAKEIEADIAAVHREWMKADKDLLTQELFCREHKFEIEAHCLNQIRDRLLHLRFKLEDKMDKHKIKYNY